MLVIRVLRVLRMARVFKLARYSRGLQVCEFLFFSINIFDLDKLLIYLLVIVVAAIDRIRLSLIQFLKHFYYSTDFRKYVA